MRKFVWQSAALYTLNVSVGCSADALLGAVGIEVAAGGLEARSLAYAALVHVEPERPRRQATQVGHQDGGS